MKTRKSPLVEHSVRLSVNAAAFFVARERFAQGKSVDESFLRDRSQRFETLAQRFPEQIQSVSLEFVDSTSATPLAATEVELSKGRMRRVIESIEQLVEDRLKAIRELVLDALLQSPENTRNIIDLFGQWMLHKQVVRLIGAGRALLVGSPPANRLAHGGANVWILGDRSPLPNSKIGGGILAVSASGRTKGVLEIMKLAQTLNNERILRGHEEIVVVGISKANAKQFRALCSKGYFLGIRPDPLVKGVTLRALGDLEEWAIGELLDALVVVAGLESGTNFRLGHEDLVAGMTGPWHQHQR